MGYSRLKGKHFKEIEELYRGPHIYLEMNRLMRDRKRLVFARNYMTYSKAQKLVDNLKTERQKNSSNIFL